MVSITIDGPAGSGKSTTAGIIADKLGYVHLNTGSIYRAIAIACRDKNFDETNEKEICEFVPTLKIDIIFENDKQKMFVNGEEVTNRLRDNDISHFSSIFSAYPTIREFATAITSNFAENNNVILDGRDSGSYVLPNADYKFYLDASSMERAKRRYAELLVKGEIVPMKQLLQEIEERDRFDKAKKLAPLVVPEGAVIIDNTKMTINQTVDEILKYIK